MGDDIKHCVYIITLHCQDSALLNSQLAGEGKQYQAFCTYITITTIMLHCQHSANSLLAGAGRRYQAFCTYYYYPALCALNTIYKIFYYQGMLSSTLNIYYYITLSA